MATQANIEKLRLLFGLGATDMGPNYQEEQAKLEKYMDAVIRATMTKRGVAAVEDLSVHDASGITVLIQIFRHELVCMHMLEEKKYQLTTAQLIKSSKEVMETSSRRHLALLKLGLTAADTDDDWAGFDPAAP